jgi:VWFA-related protein
MGYSFTARIVLTIAAALTLSVRTSGQQEPSRRFKTSVAVSIVRVDVSVHDRNGNVVRGLQADDFIITENAKPQTISTLYFDELASGAPPADAAFSLTQGVLAAERNAVTTAPPPAAASGAASAAGAKPATPGTAATPPEQLRGHRLVVLLFDTSSMQAEEVSRAVTSASTFVDKQMTSADIVAVASIGQSLQMIREFSADRDLVKQSLATLDPTTTTVAMSSDGSDIAIDDTEFGVFNNDRRLKAIKLLCDAMAPLDQKKALMYFSSGMSRTGTDNEVQLRQATNACNRSNTSIYTVDSRGLQAVVPGGDATQRSVGGQAAFSGAAMMNQFASAQSSKETLSTLASDTGGSAYLDANDFAPAFTRVQKDISGYYLIGYESTNPLRDGKYRRISVRLKNAAATQGYTVNARAGYYAGTDFAHLGKTDRERQLEDQITSAVSSTDIPVVAATSWFRTASGKFYVPVSIAVPGEFLHLPEGTTAPGPGQPDKRTTSLDLLGAIIDEQGRAVGKIRDTMQFSAAQLAAIGEKSIQYQSGVTNLPAGHFKVKVAVRENADGIMGTFEFPITIPDLKDQPVRLSPILLSTQLRAATLGGMPMPGAGFPGGGPPGGGFPGGGGPGGGFLPPDMTSRSGGAFARFTDNPLVRNGQEIVQSLTHTVAPGQPIYFYYEVYDPTVDQADNRPQLRTTLAFYRGRVKVFETPVVDHTTIDAADRKAAIFQFQISSSDLKPGLYTCQVNIADEVSRKFTFSRLALYVKSEAAGPR